MSAPVDGFHHALAEAQHAQDKERLNELAQFRSDLDNYCKAYAFLSQIIDYDDTTMEKRYLFYRALGQYLHMEGTGVEINLNSVGLTHHKLTKQQDTNLNLAGGAPTPLTPMTMVGSVELHDPKNAHWNQIIDAINELFAGTSLSEADRIAQFDLVLRKTKENTTLVDSAKANSDADFHRDNHVVQVFVDSVLDVQHANTEFTDAILKDQSSESLVKLLQLIGYRRYLAGETEQRAGD